MLRALVSSAYRWVQNWSVEFLAEHSPPQELFAPIPRKTYQKLECVVVPDEVCQTLFGDFAEHRKTHRGDEEIGWVLLGTREETEVVVHATLPAGTQRESSSTHVKFNSAAQAIASRALRQKEKSLGIVGVVHTHPGSLRHPSNGDFRGDALWVGKLRGGDGVFGIGTADARGEPDRLVQVEPFRQIQGELCFTWYGLKQGDSAYRKLPVRVTVGPDLAKPLHPVWSTLERHAAGLDRLFRQQAQVSLEVIEEPEGAVLGVKIPLAEPGSCLRLLLQEGQARYYVEKKGHLFAIPSQSEPLEVAVYLILAELCASGGLSRETFTWVDCFHKETVMDFRPLNDTERQKLIDALCGNALNNQAILMNQRDTSFAGASDEMTDDEVISAIQSVPCHY